MQRIIFSLIIIILANSHARADSVDSNQYVIDKQAHAELLRQQANDRVAYLRDSKQPDLISTGASLGALEPAAGGPPPLPLKAMPASDKANSLKTNDNKDN